jgi:hypothetical protein
MYYGDEGESLSANDLYSYIINWEFLYPIFNILPVFLHQ